MSNILSHQIGLLTTGSGVHIAEFLPIVPCPALPLPIGVDIPVTGAGSRSTGNAWESGRVIYIHIYAQGCQLCKISYCMPVPQALLWKSSHQTCCGKYCHNKSSGKASMISLVGRLPQQVQWEDFHDKSSGKTSMTRLVQEINTTKLVGRIATASLVGNFPQQCFWEQLASIAPLHQAYCSY